MANPSARATSHCTPTSLCRTMVGGVDACHLDRSGCQSITETHQTNNHACWMWYRFILLYYYQIPPPPNPTIIERTLFNPECNSFKHASLSTRYRKLYFLNFLHYSFLINSPLLWQLLSVTIFRCVICFWDFPEAFIFECTRICVIPLKHGRLAQGLSSSEKQIP